MKQYARTLTLLLSFSLLAAAQAQAAASDDAAIFDGLQAPNTPPPASDLPAPSLGAPADSAPPTPPPPVPSAANPPPAAAPKAVSANGTSAAGSSGLSAPTPPGTSAPPPPPAPGTEPAAKAEGAEESLPAPESANPPPDVPPPLPPKAEGGSHQDRGIYQDYRDYQDRERDRQVTENEYDRRKLFPHEDGAWQIGLDYTRNGFAGYGFGPGAPTYSTQGGAATVFYYPLRNLDFGRLGLGATGGLYWTNFTASYRDTGGTQRFSSVRHRTFSSYGGRVAYEFDYFLGQWLVPHVFYGIEQVSGRAYQLQEAGINYLAHNFTTHVYGGGLHLNLNRIEPSTASKALVSTGVRKFYLTYTALMHASAAAGSGLNHFLGLRFEY